MLRLTRSFKVPFFGQPTRARRAARRKEDDGEHRAEDSVLRALQLMARQSSPHKASARSGIARAISVIEASMLGLDQINELISECVSLCQAGLQTESRNKRDLLAERYGEILEELNAIAQGTGHAGCHLIGDTSCILEVELGEPGEFKLKLPHINLTAGSRGLALPKPARAFETTDTLGHFERHLKLVAERLNKSEHIFRDHAADLAKRLALLLEGPYQEDGDLPEGSIRPTHLRRA